MQNAGCQWVNVDEQNPNILMFMYADDNASGTDMAEIGRYPLALYFFKDV